ncbi:MAG: zinc-binding dehydrogenase [Tropicimonas sp.]|uniref:zinc-binding dehydrogenase n=1 Tax=Tropicimonas sp. TaxID=2067044 RepID=UPI003A8883A7
MRRLFDLCARGALRPIVGANLPFDDIAKAHALAGDGHKRGAVVVFPMRDVARGESLSLRLFAASLVETFWR